MKKILRSSIILAIWMSMICKVYPQKSSEIEGIEITEVLMNENRITTEKDGDEFEFILPTNLKIKTKKKGKVLDRYQIQAGMLIDIAYEIIDTIYVAQKITVLEDQEFSLGGHIGYFDYWADTVAFVGGKKVILAPGVTIQGDEEKNCKCKGYPFKDFQKKPLKYGYSLTIKGKQRPDGVLVAEKVTACNSDLAEAIEKVITETSDRYEGGKLIFKQAQGIYKGNLVANGVTYKLHPSDALQEYVVSVGTKMLPAYLNTDEKDNAEIFKYRFLVIDNNLPEAFSWPNGMVFINTGLLCTLTNEAQLAFVIGRELAHINYHHTAKRLQKVKGKNKVMNGFKSLLTKVPDFVDAYKTKKDSTNADSAVVKNDMEKMLNKYADIIDKGLGKGINRQLLGSLLLVQDRLKPAELIGQYSLAQEAEADEVALSYMYIAGYDVREAPKFWTSLLEKMKKPGFMTNVTKSIKKMIPTDLLDAFKGDIKAKLLAKPIDNMMEKVFTSIFNTPKLTQKRLNRVKGIIQNNYPGYEFYGNQTDPKKYASIIGVLKCQ
jgi:beta-barrel assembly-enhancing protease